MLEKLRSLFARSPERHRPEPTEQVEDGAVRIEGKTYGLKRWSRKGFVATPCGPHFSDGDEVSIDVTLKLAGAALEFSGLAMVRRADVDADEMECQFVDVEHAARIAIDRHFDALAGQPPD